MSRRRKGIYGFWKRLPARPKNRLAVIWYSLMSRFDTGDDLLFLNHGWAETGTEPDSLELDQADRKHRYPIQLYHRVASAIDWAGADAIEVSCGKGGGTDYVMRTFAPRSLVGIDLARGSIRFCRRRHRREGLTFEVGDAQSLPLPDASRDIVLNVESSFNYPRVDAFYAEVNRVLRPGGHFLYCDYRRRRKMEDLDAKLVNSGLERVRFDEVSPNIVRALQLDDHRKQDVIARHVPRSLRRLAEAFAFANEGQKTECRLFEDGKKVYFISVFRKPA